jgi:pimeloyl-ACP methyl ester carboxylesterase
MFFISFATLFVSKSEYGNKVEESRNSQIVVSTLLDGWRLDSLISPNINITHRFLRSRGDSSSTETILFIHGLNFTAEIFQKLSSLNKKADLISIQLPEKTDFYQGSINNYTTIIDDLLTLLGKKSVTICGTSFGGQIAAHYAVNGKVKTKSLFLISTKLASSTRKDKKQMESLNRLVKRKEDYQIYWIMEKLINRFKEDLTESEKSEILPMLKIRQIPFYRQTTYSMYNYKTEDDIKKLSIPITLINGDQDHLISPKDMDNFKSVAPQTKIVEIKNGTHAITWTNNEEIVNIIEKNISKK